MKVLTEKDDGLIYYTVSLGEVSGRPMRSLEGAVSSFFRALSEPKTAAEMRVVHHVFSMLEGRISDEQG